MSRRRTARTLAALVLGSLVAGPALAEFVTLRTRDGSVAITGQLAGFADGTYTLSTNIGMVNLPAEMVECLGEACPEVPGSRGFRMSGSRALADRVAPSLLAAFAAGRGGGASRRTETGAMAFALGEEETGEAVIAPHAGTAGGIADLLSGKADLAMAARPVTSGEAAAFEAAGWGALREIGFEHAVGTDGLVLAVHPGNPVESMSLADATRVLSGEVTDWSALGGPPGPVTLYVREPGAGPREMMTDLLLAPRGLSLSAKATALDDAEALAAAIEGDPGGLAVSGYARHGGKALAVGGACGIRVPPTPFAIASGEYPLARPLLLYRSRGNTSDAAGAFLAFVASAEGQAIVAASGIVPLAVAPRPVHGDGLRLAAALQEAQAPADLILVREMAMQLIGAERLAVTFRFEPGTARLTARSQADLFRLAAYLEEAGRGREAIFAGFAARSGKAAADRRLSRERAERVRRAVLAAWPGPAAEPASRAAGFGHVSPLTCPGDEDRGIENRVEVWLRGAK